MADPRPSRRAALATLLAWGASLGGCGPAEPVYQPRFVAQGANAKPEYVIGIHPLHNPKRLLEVYAPVVDALNAAIPEAHFRLEASRNYEAFEHKLFDGYFHFAMPNPYETVRALRHGYRVFGKMGDDENFRGLILVRKDSGIQAVTDLKGKKVAYPAATALAATMLPQHYLHTHGLDINRDIENVYVGSQESAIMNVVLGQTAAGATWPIPWKTFGAEKPELAQQLEVKWQTRSLPNNGWVARQDMPLALTQQVVRVLTTLHESEAGREILRRLPISRFETADDATYQPVRDYLDTFSRTVRHLEW